MKGELLVSQEKKNISSKMDKSVSDWLLTGGFLTGVDSVIRLSYINFFTQLLVSKKNSANQIIWHLHPGF